MENDLVRAFDLLDQDDRVKAIVITGEGKHFCAGADLEIGLERTEGVGSKEHRDGYVVLLFFSLGSEGWEGEGVSRAF
jgi:enoyl-CoA hydratase/carnithine racemase